MGTAARPRRLHLRQYHTLHITSSITSSTQIFSLPTSHHIFNPFLSTVHYHQEGSSKFQTGGDLFCSERTANLLDPTPPHHYTEPSIVFFDFPFSSNYLHFFRKTKAATLIVLFGMPAQATFEYRGSTSSFPDIHIEKQTISKNITLKKR